MDAHRYHRNLRRGIGVGAVIAVALLSTPSTIHGGAVASASYPNHREVADARVAPVERAAWMPGATATPTPAPPAVDPAPAAPVAAAAPPSGPHRLYLASDDGVISTPVGFYGDCSGSTRLGSTPAIDTCVPWLFLVGHNPGVFTGLFSEGVGAGFTWWDGNGVPHHLHVTSVRYTSWPFGMPWRNAGTYMQFQTCANAAGTVDRIMDLALG